MKEIRAFGILFWAGVIAQAILVLGNLVLARIYPPSAFGELGYFSIFATFSIVAGLRLDYIAFSHSSRERSIYFTLALICSCVLCCAVVLIMCVLTLMGYSTVRHTIWGGAFIASSSAYYLCSQFYIANQNYSDYAKARLIQSIIQIFGALLLFFVAENTGLLLAIVISQVMIGSKIAWEYRNILVKNTKIELINCWQSSYRDAISNSLLCLVQYSTPFAPILVGTIFFSSNEVGAYFLFSSAIAGPLAIFRRAATNMLNVEANEPLKALSVCRNRTNQVALLLAAILCVTTVVSIILLFANQYVTDLIFGVTWLPYSSLLLPIVVFCIVDAILQPVTTLLPLWGHLKLALACELLRFVLVFIATPMLIMIYDLSFMNSICIHFLFMMIIYFAIFIFTSFIAINYEAS